jgi:hypothetical protein
MNERFHIDFGRGAEPLTAEEQARVDDLRAQAAASDDRKAFARALSDEDRVLLMRAATGWGAGAIRLMIEMEREREEHPNGPHTAYL